MVRSVSIKVHLVSAFGFKVATFCIKLQPKKLQLFEEEALQLYAVQYREADLFVSQQRVFSIVFCGGTSHMQGRFPMCQMMGLTNDKFHYLKAASKPAFHRLRYKQSRHRISLSCWETERSVFRSPFSHYGFAHAAAESLLEGACGASVRPDARQKIKSPPRWRED